MLPLHNTRVLTLTVNLPGPMAACRLRQLGATVVKIEPPGGDPLAAARPAWYEALHADVQIIQLDLKTNEGQQGLGRLLEQTDLLLTATRPTALARLGLAWPVLHEKYPRLCQVGIVGYALPQDGRPGHDLTYQAQAGLLQPPNLPRTLIADIGGAMEAVSAALALLFARERNQEAGYLQVSLAEAALHFADSLRYGLTAPGAILGGGYPGYDLYAARDGWIALAALEPHFGQRLCHELRIAALDRALLAAVFATRTAQEWEVWGAERDLPLVAVADLPRPG